jgi:hypothetical protein
MILLTRRSAVALLAVGAGLRGVTAAEPMRIRDLYGRGAEFSGVATSLSGKQVAIRGFMAPPLKPEADFFVLTKLPMAVCPFCDSELDWPTDIVLVKLRRAQEWIDFNLPILVRGRLELGTAIDGETGFVSRVRIVDGAYELI